MITYEQARQKVREFLDRREAEYREILEYRKGLTAKEREILGFPATDEDGSLVIVDEATITEDFGWVFFVQSETYLKTGNAVHQLVGHGPIIVSRTDGGMHHTGSAYPSEFYIENFRRFGSPYGIDSDS